MPTVRPSSPAVKSTTNVIAQNADQIWLVDQTSGSTVPDLNSGRSMTLTNATFVTDTYMGRAIASSGSGIQGTAANFTSAKVSAYPFAFGAIFTKAAVGNAGGSSVITFVDDLLDYGAGGLWSRIYIDNTSGVVIVTWRVISGDSQGVIITSNALTTTGTNTIAVRVDAYNSVSVGFNGTLTNTISNPSTNPGWDASLVFGEMSFLCTTDHDHTGISLVAESDVHLSCGWRAHGAGATAMTNSELVSQSGDAWLILEPSGLATRSGAAAITTAAATVGSAGTVAISGHLT